MRTTSCLVPLFAACLLLAIFFYANTMDRIASSTIVISTTEANIKPLNSYGLLEATQVLDQRDDMRPAIFLIETTSNNVSARQACAVESAALLHPEADVYLLLMSPPYSSDVVQSNPHLRQLAEHYPNVQVLYYHLLDYFRDGPLEQWYKLGLLGTSSYKTEHTSDVVRYYTLWKYGGTYIDLDVVLMRSLKGMKNFAGAESHDDVANGILNMERRSRLALECVYEIREHFRGDLWVENGPGVIRRVLQRVCETNRAIEMTRHRCLGDFEVMPPKFFYPVHYSNWEMYFNESTADATMEAIAFSHAIHVWNKLSFQAEVSVGSKQPYGQVAAKFCPKVYFGCGPAF